MVGSWRWCAAAMAATTVSAAASAQGPETPLGGAAMYGIGRSSGQLVRYDVDTGDLRTVGPVVLTAETVTGIEASAYVPGDVTAGGKGFQNLFAFWTDPQDSTGKLLYVDIETGRATVMHDVEGGRMTGAVAVQQGEQRWHVYGVQSSDAAPTFAVAGNININPNNSHHSEFELTKPDGGMITRDDLHQGSSTSPTGDYYVGDATLIRVRPKANQSSLYVDGQPYGLGNETYVLSGHMKVRVYNDHRHRNGKAMGKWWIQIISGEAMFGEGAQGASGRLVRIDHRTGDVTELMPLARAYDGLASANGATFFATAGDRIYELDPLAGTESLVTTVSVQDVHGLEFYGGALAGFATSSQRLVTFDPSSERALSVADLGTIVFVPVEQDPSLLADAFD